MKLTTKATILLSVVSAATVSAGVVMSKNPFNFMTIAEGEVCEHVGNHYSERDATNDTTGCKEYWVCCTCHEHFVGYVAGTWTDKGQATIVFPETAESLLDTRFIPKKSETQDMLKALQDMGFTVTTKTLEDGSVGYIVSNYTGSEAQIIIPEGVVGIENNTFMGNSGSIQIVIPESMDDIDLGKIFKTGAAKKDATLYFVGDTQKTSSQLGCKALYKILDVGWRYENGVPTAIGSSY